MRRAGVTLILLTMLAGLAIAFADTAPSGDAPPPQRQRDHRDDDRGRPEGPRRDGPPRDGQPPVALTPEQIAEAVEVMRQISPWWADRLEEAKQEDEQRFVNMVTRMYPRLRQFLELRRHDPPLYELRIAEARYDSQSRRLSWQLYHAQQRGDDPELAEKLKGELREVLAQQFEVTQEARQHEIDALKRRIAALETELADHRRDRDALIDRRYEELMEQAERLDRRRQRDAPGPPGPPGPLGPRPEL